MTIRFEIIETHMADFDTKDHKKNVQDFLAKNVEEVIHIKHDTRIFTWETWITYKPKELGNHPTK